MKNLLELKGISRRVSDRFSLRDVTLAVEPGQIVGFVGANGAGKTTFLRLVMNEETPDTGWVQRGPSVRTAYLPQIVRFAVPERSMLDTMLYECKCTPQEARDQLAAYGFCGEDVLKPVSALSGGELSRLRLCMLMDEKINLLVLDEPTNHLDVASREWIEEAVEAFDEIIENMPESEKAFELAKQGILANLSTQRTVRDNVLWSFVSAREMGVGVDRNKAVYDAVQGMTLADVKAAQEKWVKNRKYVYGILGDIQDLDLNYLKTLGPIRTVSQEEIFGY